MKKTWILLALPMLLLVSCGNKEETKTMVKNSEPRGMVIKDDGKKRSDIINNILVGKSKFSFNNAPYDKMSDGKFTQSEMWGTFKSKDDPTTIVQINASDNQQKIYGDIIGYELEDVKWDTEEAVQYSGFMEEALQFSKDKKTLMYKARTGDVIFSITMFGQKKLTDKNILSLKTLAKGVKVEYVEEQVTSSQ
ncbi:MULTISPECIES: hypothetical protein [Vagococcus]|uniref:Lipoprotein n=1 Tax=Vagococcus fluvialis bH819 TaxID=1255619 RepID=A0A1X6WSJ8_9ENTE|nr:MULTISPECIES: hypothetical protein [Vagococcus]SLM87202.1 hypothetical protein FM121_13970 [Vagococcus fluvialis bH819]HCM90064.1 hypothetical protein [Vagococcus sp.]